MEYPVLNVKQKSREMTEAFLGYNHNMRIGDNEFYDMKNMTSDHYPALAPRKRRGTFAEGTDVNGLIVKEKLCYVKGSSFVIGDEEIDMGLSTRPFECPKDLVSMGAYVIIMPDAKYINTVKKNGMHEYGDINRTYMSTGKDVTFTLCTQTGESYESAEPSNVAPTNPTDGKLWLDTSSTPNTLKKYYKANGMWVSIATTYVKIQAQGIGLGFNQYDGVKIEGIVAEGATDLNGSFALWGCKTDEIIITGMLNKVVTQKAAQGTVAVARLMPVMDFIVESNNRLWGCHYGTTAKGEVVNEIYASKLGDFKNWDCFMGLSTDSYVASCGTDGPFTGAVSYLGYPLFFKENCIHKVYGDYPANYQIQVTNCRGVQKGSDKSLAVVNETLFYKSANSVCAYDGSLPVEMSSAFGDVRYSDAVACAYGNKYYIDMKAADDTYHLFVYDTAKGMWHKEDNIHVDSFCPYKNEIYAIDYDTGNIVTMFGSGTMDSEKVPWMVETGLIGMSMPDMKYISKLLVRMSLEVGAKVEISIQYDSIGDWERVCQMTATSLRSFAVPIRPRRCDHFRIRIVGEGDCRIYSITKTIEQGSDVS